ncbi:5-oxoprolinase subunit PxpB [Alkalibacillus haloalkaliphilus]|uniref:Kinase n=1 Tax=Alkalibacillus haloalkaliphilus TaxID=94136 RepID=A0A511W4H3_9BACI|nr:5-oxoprolinase subunit PxpB [Alkalibacillus haloalkaliphilus]GEN46004.1 kinase [Alkalibacillus haloalkaliphilus]
MDYSLHPLGNQALVISFGDEISQALHEQVVATYKSLQQARIAYVTDLVPTYRSVAVYYNWRVVSYCEVEQRVQALMKTVQLEESLNEQKVINLPVCYEGEFAPDLQALAEFHNMSQQEVIKRHSEPNYLVYMIGFLPGFPYLGGLDDELETQRLQTPRAEVSKGSVGIAGKQTGVYPVSSPGGWHIIGNTPIELFDVKREQPVLFEVGDQLKFYPVTRSEYDWIYEKGCIEDFIQ